MREEGKKEEDRGAGGREGEVGRWRERKRRREKEKERERERERERCGAMQ
jgi:hypothetical protein